MVRTGPRRRPQTRRENRKRDVWTCDSCGGKVVNPRISPKWGVPIGWATNTYDRNTLEFLTPRIVAGERFPDDQVIHLLICNGQECVPKSKRFIFPISLHLNRAAEARAGKCDANGRPLGGE